MKTLREFTRGPLRYPAIKIKNVVQTCEACPSQWEAETESDAHVLIRYRWGVLTVAIDEILHYSAVHGTGIDGVIEWSKVIAVTGIVEVDNNGKKKE